MVRARRKRVKNPDKVYSFREELVQLYHKLKVDIEALCKKHGATVNYWYSPSSIFQPKFIIDDVEFTADELCNEKELRILASQTRKRYAR
jgi:hypothetical protein